ncbi:hypothetical protein GGX14DRAFT_540813 [Mycena pura]|uniref:NAD(P)-binding protein n=1 Tax=Mycena pura TaxID=153505 RepID=A0AAD6VRU0_9AGAR|nr:hypothetical protein GGX14DRAFT_540813 [Mycena pura]
MTPKGTALVTAAQGIGRAIALRLANDGFDVEVNDLPQPSSQVVHRPTGITSKGTALVTGAAQGIGRAIALRLANDGFDVAVNDLPSKTADLAKVVAEIRASGRGSSAHVANVSDEHQVRRLVETVVLTHGGLDVMVANAGLATWKSLLDTTAEEWDRTMAVNSRGTFLCYKYAAKQMVQQGRGGRIIGACSVAGKIGFPFLATYCASKFAVRGLTQAAAQELGKYRITVNAYAPGAIDSIMLLTISLARIIQYQVSSLAELSTKDTAMSPELWLDAQKKVSPLGRLGTANEVESLVSFIASQESQFITGQSAVLLLPLAIIIVTPAARAPAIAVRCPLPASRRLPPGARRSPGSLRSCPSRHLLPVLYAHAPGGFPTSSLVRLFLTQPSYVPYIQSNPS